jgi:soluble lytic murein transglycosylase-like protein
VAITLLLLLPSRTSSSAELVDTILVESPQAPSRGLNKQYDRQLIDELISRYASKYGVSEWVMHEIIRKESRYIYNAIGDTNYVCKRTGQISPSYGLAQINRCWHNYSIEQLNTPEFAIEFLARHLAQGNCGLWSTCPSHVIPNSTSTIN